MLPKLESHSDERGCLSVIQNGTGLDFEVRRLYMVHGMSGLRGEHAHRLTNQILICTSGNIELEIRSSKGELKKYVLNPYEHYLRIYPLSWIRIVPKSDASSYIVLADTIYEEKDTIRSFEQYLRLCRQQNIDQ